MQTEIMPVTEEKKLSDNDIKQYLISDENYQLLRNYQKLIVEALEFSPAIRKLLNELITVENLEKVKAKFIANWCL